MKKKETNEKIAQFIKQCADEIRNDLDYELRVANSHMLRAEHLLISSFTDEQRELYNEYLEARQAYFDAFNALHNVNKK